MLYAHFYKVVIGLQTKKINTIASNNIKALFCSSFSNQRIEMITA